MGRNGDRVQVVLAALLATLSYYRALYQHIALKKPYNTSTVFDDDKWAKVQVYSLSLIFDLWHKPHYRSRHFQQDMLDNLRNVAVPGTGIPLSYLCRSYLLCLFAVLFLNPLVCLLGAINKARRTCNCFAHPHIFVTEICYYYTHHLLHPDDWFSLWRLNCRLASVYSCVTHSEGYRFEDKWTFLKEGDGVIPISPYLHDVQELVCKNKNVEGGLAIHFYRNALFGGEWILQPKLANAAWLQKLLPEDAPLSTMRVITMSTAPLQDHAGSTCNNNPHLSTNGHSKKKKKSAAAEEENGSECIHVMSSVLRLGRRSAATDHSSVLFDVDAASGVITHGLSNAHWYQLGAAGIRAPWLPPEAQNTHPDNPTVTITGQQVPQMSEAVKIVKDAHFAMMKDVPIVGWDVAFTDKGVYLLEVNLSCNFFRGSFDQQKYIDIVDRYFSMLDEYEKKK